MQGIQKVSFIHEWKLLTRNFPFDPSTNAPKTLKMVRFRSAEKIFLLSSRSLRDAQASQSHLAHSMASSFLCLTVTDSYSLLFSMRESLFSRSRSWSMLHGAPCASFRCVCGSHLSLSRPPLKNVNSGVWAQSQCVCVCVSISVCGRREQPMGKGGSDGSKHTRRPKGSE